MKSLFFIVARSMRQHLLSTIITIVSAGLASGLVMSVFTVSEQSKTAFTGGDIGYDAVLGAKGSELQLVLNTVFHLEASPGNIPWSLYQTVKADSRVKYAIPYALGAWRVCWAATSRAHLGSACTTPSARITA